ncbi:MAG: glycosyltransferase [Bacillota bacterium]
MSSRSILLTAGAVNSGAVLSHVVSLAREMERRGHRVVVASPGGPGARRLTHVPLCLRTPWDLARAVYRVRQLLERTCPDIVHAHGQLSAWVCQRARSGYPVAMAVTYHEEESPGFHWKHLARPGDLTIATTEKVRHHLIREFGFTGVQLIPAGIDTNLYAPGDQATAKRQLELDEAMVVSAMGRWRGPEGSLVHCLIDACDFLLDKWPGLQLLVAGDGSGRADIRVRAARAKSRVILSGNVTGAATVFHAADVVVATGRTALEALSCSRPVLVAGRDGIVGPLTPASFSRLEQAGFSARGMGMPLDAGRIRDLLDFMLARPGLGRQLGLHGRRLLEEKLSVSAVTGQLLEHYALTLSKRGAG